MSLYDPRNRKELYYKGILDGDHDLPSPQTREEIYLKAIAEKDPIAVEAEVVQERGYSSENVMSQKAVTEEFNKFFSDTVTSSNIFNINNSVYNDDYSDIGYVYMNGYSGHILISTADNYASYFSNVTAYDGDNSPTSLSAVGSKYAIVTGGYRTGYIFDVPSGTIYVTFVYRYKTVSDTPLVTDPMVTKGDTLESGEYVPYKAFTTVNGSDYVTYNDLNRNRGNRPVYVDPTGSDSNTGLSPDDPVATIGKAFSIGNKIYAKRSTYIENIILSGQNGIVIMPWDNDETFTNSNPVRDKIRILGGYEYLKSDISIENGLYIKTDVPGNIEFDRCFTRHVYTPILNADKELYRCNVQVIYSDVSKMCKLYPVLSTTDCGNTADSFTWDNGKLYCNISDTSFIKVAVIYNDHDVLDLEGCRDVELVDCAFLYSHESPLVIKECDSVSLVNCESSYSSIDMGFNVINSNVSIINCYATHNGYDGFNFHSYGYSEMRYCISEYNWDDGCSHHDGTVGDIIGGRFTGNGKAGIAPAYGAIVNIYDVITDHNNIGIGYLSTSGHQNMTGKVFNCVIVSNENGLLYQALCTVITVNCIYSDNTTDKSGGGTIIEYS